MRIAAWSEAASGTIPAVVDAYGGEILEVGQLVDGRRVTS
jgi:hypothetical protein